MFFGIYMVNKKNLRPFRSENHILETERFDESGPVE